MSPVLVAMALLGCSDAGDQCQTLRILPVRYESVAACYAASNDVLLREADDEAPMMAVRCLKVPASMAVDQPIVVASAN